MADKTTLDKTSRARRVIVRKAEQALLTRSATVETRLLKLLLNELAKIIDVKNGAFVAGGDGLAKFEASTFLQKFFQDTATPTLRKLFDKAFRDLNEQAAIYFSKFKNPNFEEIKNSIFANLAQTAGTSKDALKKGNGFIPRLLTNNTIEGKVRRIAVQAITAGQSLADFRKVARIAIEGTTEKLGIVENYYYTNAHDAFAEYDRTIQNNFAKALDLNYAIYQGGEIKSTREFCEERNANVYNRETILSWNLLDWQGKREGHNVLLDAGGYNCRHYYDWISWELAKQLDSNIQRSAFDVQIEKDIPNQPQ